MSCESVIGENWVYFGDTPSFFMPKILSFRDNCINIFKKLNTPLKRF